MGDQADEEALDACSFCVVGAGTIGSWTALHLVRELAKTRPNVKVALLDQFPLPHTRGSSHGGSRVIRMLGDDHLAKLEYSYAQWRQLEAETRSRLLVRTGLLNFGVDEAAPTGEGQSPGQAQAQTTGEDEYLRKYTAVLREAGYPTEWLRSADIARLLPDTSFPASWGATSDPSGSILLASKCVAAVQTVFAARGGVLVHAKAVAVRDLGADGSVVSVQRPGARTAKSHTFERTIVCAGPWTSVLLPVLRPVLRAQAIPVTYWRMKANATSCPDQGVASSPAQASNCSPRTPAPIPYSVASGFPVLFNARLKNIYTVPAYEYSGLVKCLYHGGPFIDPEARDSGDGHDAALLGALEPFVEHVRQYVREHLPLLDPSQPAILETCCYTITPDSQPIMDRLGGSPANGAPSSVVVGAGYSGSGFKHSPASGHILSSLALGTETELPSGYLVSKYRIDRFGAGNYQQGARL